MQRNRRRRRRRRRRSRGGGGGGTNPGTGEVPPKLHTRDGAGGEGLEEDSVDEYCVMAFKPRYIIH